MLLTPLHRSCRVLAQAGLVLLIVSCMGTAAPLPVQEPAARDLVRAQLTARRQATLAAEINARVNRVHVAEGGSFREGDPLVSFDSRLQSAQLERARAVLAAAETTAAANERLLTLHSIGQVEAELSRAEVRKARAELAAAEAMFAKCEIRAPFSGRVAEQRVHEQEFVQPGQALLEIVDDSTPQIDFIAPSKWLAWMKPGQPVDLHIDDTGTTYRAVIERIGAKADPVSQSIKVVAGFVEPPTEVIPGMSGAIRLPPAAPQTP